MAYTRPPKPDRAAIQGQYCQLVPLSPDHAADLFAAQAQDAQGRMWDYMPQGPFAALDEYRAWLDGAVAGDDPLHFAVLVDGQALGSLSFLRIDPGAGSIEIGYVAFAPALQRTQAATEAFFLLMDWAFTAGYRRLEWKCNALNVPSRTAALRLGLSYEGVFRQATIVKGRNRDTAWFAAIDREWVDLKRYFQTWLASENFDANGQQRQSLSALTKPIVAASMAAEFAGRPVPGQIGELV